MKAYKDSVGDTSYINDNIVSSTHLQPMNLNTIGGTASQTRNLRMGANLPNGAEVGDQYKQPVTIYDSLGSDATIQFSWEKMAQNRWDLEAIPPSGAKSLLLKQDSSTIYSAMGRLDFNGEPTTAGVLQMEINGTTYSFNTNGTANSGDTADQFYIDPAASASTGTFVDNMSSEIDRAFQLEYNSISLDLSGGATASSSLVMTVDGTDYTFDTSTATDAGGVADMLNDASVNPNFSALGLVAYANGTDLHIYSKDAMSFDVNTTSSTNEFAVTSDWSATSKTTDGIAYCERIAGTESLVFRQRDNNNDLVISGLDTLELADGNPATLQGMDPLDTDGFTVDSINISGATSEDAIELNGDGTPK